MSGEGAGADSVRGMRQGPGALYELTIPPPDPALSNADLAYAWFAGFGVAFVVYAALMRGTALVDLSRVPAIEAEPDSQPPAEVSE